MSKRNSVGAARSIRLNQRGAVIIQVAVAILGLVAFSAFVIDLGVMWVSRGQAQNAADAAALAGAISLTNDGGSSSTTFNCPPGSNTPACQSARHWAQRNSIWGQTNDSANVDVTLSGPGSSVAPCGTRGGCVRVDIYRGMPRRGGGAAVGNPIPAFFGPMIGITHQGVRATATAEAQPGNVVSCMLPFAVADRWADATDELIDVLRFANDGDHILLGDPIKGWSPNDLYQGALSLPLGLDYYRPPNAPGHTGWTLANDYGRQLILKDGAGGQFSAGWSNKVDLPGSSGSDDYRSDIEGCNTAQVGIAPPEQTCTGYPNSGTTPDEAKAGCLGVSAGLSSGPTDQGVEGSTGLIKQDPGAVWKRNVIGPLGQQGAVVTTSGTVNMTSPRIRSVPIFDITHYMANPSCRSQAGTGCIVKVVNIIGFFVEGMCDTVRAAGLLEPGVNCGPGSQAHKEVVGRIVTMPSSYARSGGKVTTDAAFLRVPRLVR